jgi:Peptidase of plants and bacteria
MTKYLLSSNLQLGTPSSQRSTRGPFALVLLGLGLASGCGAPADAADLDLGVAEAALITEEVFEFGNYRLLVTNEDPALSDEIIVDLVNTHFIVYPHMRARYNPNAPLEVRFVFRSDHPYPASASGDTVTFDSDHMIDNPLDWDIVTHEDTHVLQAPAYGPSWIIEGTADYVRNLYGINNSVSGWRLTDEPSRYYNAGYGHTALFFMWVEDNHYETLVEDLTTILLAQQYSEATWEELTGSTLEELWNEYRPALPIPSDAATFHEHIEYGGQGVTIEPGTYTLGDLLARGVPNDWVSSVWVPDGIEVQIFWDDGLGGSQLTLTENARSLLDFGANDVMSSVVIRRR